MNSWRNARNISNVITRVVADKAATLGFTDVSHIVTEIIDNKYLLSIIFSYRGNQYSACSVIVVTTLQSLEDSEITPFVMRQAKDLLRVMCRVSGKNKEIPQTEEEYEQKIRWYQL